MEFNKSFYDSLHNHLQFTKDVDLQANGDATVNLIVKTINTFSHSNFIISCVSALNYGNPNDVEFCHRLFKVSCMLVKYRRDPQGHEIVFTPKLLIKVGQGDCKKFTTFIGAVLKNKGIVSIPKVVSYDGDAWEHIYIIVPNPNEKNYITLDPVNHQKYNVEVNYKKARLNYLNGTYSKDMTKLSIMGNLPTDGFLNNISKSANDVLGDLEAIAGTDTNVFSLAGLERDYINGINDENQINGYDDIGKKKSKAEKKQKRKNFFHKAKGAAFVTQRATFLGLILLGGALAKTPLKINLAKKLAQAWQKDNGKKLKEIWYKFGGNPDKLRDTIIKASKIQINGTDFSIGSNGDMQIAGIGVVTAASATAAIAAATPIIVAIMKVLKKEKVVSEEDTNKVSDTLEKVETMATDASGSIKQSVADVIKESPVAEAGKTADAGGNPEAQREAIQDFRRVQASSAAETTADAPQSDLPTANAPVQGSMFGGLLAINTWMKSIIIFGIVPVQNEIASIILNSICGVSVGMLAILTVSKASKFLIKKIKQNEQNIII